MSPKSRTSFSRKKSKHGIRAGAQPHGNATGSGRWRPPPKARPPVNGHHAGTPAAPLPTDSAAFPALKPRVTIVMWLYATGVISVASNYIINELLAAKNKASSKCTGALHTRSSTHAPHTCPCAPDMY